MQHRLAGRRHAELGRVGLAEDDQARRAQPVDEFLVVGRHGVGHEPRALAEPNALDLAGRSLARNGTPANGPDRCPQAASTAWSKAVVTTALSFGFSASIRWMAASTSSAG